MIIGIPSRISRSNLTLNLTNSDSVMMSASESTQITWMVKLSPSSNISTPATASHPTKKDVRRLPPNSRSSKLKSVPMEIRRSWILSNGIVRWVFVNSLRLSKAKSKPHFLWSTKPLKMNYPSFICVKRPPFPVTFPCGSNMVISSKPSPKLSKILWSELLLQCLRRLQHFLCFK